ncbi:hypothetical protein [Demequina capsici]|uniref:Uncharacterized protein n=1 Tax=Demequina capsici TaxID=3075620 RepID=A0AA96F7V8_9MICO|nr:hypothetical protein [Demequina sp. OYTSA14]WNM24437.1 hypothetical protein RN606_13895 [Demequina sp. OYTSA14]
MSDTQAPVEPWEARPRGRWPEWARTLVALAAAAAVLWAVVQFGTGGVLVAGFGALIGLGYVAAALIGGPVLLTLIAKKLTGVPHTVGAIAGTVISVLLTIVAASHYGQLSMMWVPALGIDVAYPLAGLAGALVWSASVGPWPFRVLGALAGVGAVGLAFAVLGSDPLIPAVRVGAPSAEEDFEDFSDSIDDFLSTDAPGTTLAEVRTDHRRVSLLVTADGGVVQIWLYDYHVDDPNHESSYPCWIIAEPNAGVVMPDRGELDLTAADYSDSCVFDDDGWRRVDGLAYVRPWGDEYAFVEPADLSYIRGDGTRNVADAGGVRVARADEVAAVAATLRPIDDAEIRVAYDAANRDQLEP